jgi:hypothetical protein
MCFKIIVRASAPSRRKKSAPAGRSRAQSSSWARAILESPTVAHCRGPPGTEEAQLAGSSEIFWAGGDQAHFPRSQGGKAALIRQLCGWELRLSHRSGISFSRGLFW